jgi:hypothetical protein
MDKHIISSVDIPKATDTYVDVPHWFWPEFGSATATSTVGHSSSGQECERPASEDATRLVNTGHKQGFPT